jgi:branched-chain amino acid transport system ATP-binding protein
MLDSEKTDNLLEINNIEVIYNHVILVLKGVSLSVPKGGITALLGGNGAGKTTTLKAVSNLLHSERGEVTKGSISYRGDPVAGLTLLRWLNEGLFKLWKVVTVLNT